MQDLDWRWLKSFVAVADAGRMQVAVKRSGISQPTLSRHIKQLEEAVEMPLFERHGRRLRLSAPGLELFERAMDVREAVKAFERRAVGVSEEEAGSVRVTMTQMFGFHFGAHWLAAFRRANPHITVDLVLADDTTNLLMREAEIAERMFRPKQLDLVTRRCGETRMGFYASEDYLEERGTPSALPELLEHDFIGFDRLMTWITAASSMGFEYSREDFNVRTDAMFLHHRLAEAGLGLVVLPIHAGARANLTRVLPEVEMPGQPIYLAAHPDLYRNPRVARLWEHLSAALEARFRRAR